MAKEMGKLNYYEVMDLSPDTVHADLIKARYLELKSFYSSEDAQIKRIFTDQELVGLQEILEEAYAVLGNQTLKAIYDEKTQGKVSQVRVQASEQVHGESRILDPVKIKTGYEEPSVSSSRLSPSAKVASIAYWKLEFERDEGLEAWVASNLNWDGPALKRVREYKNVDVNQLSQFTKINPFYITAIESLQPDCLPASVFVRGYIIQICRALGLNEQQVAASYMKSYQQACENKKNLSL